MKKKNIFVIGSRYSKRATIIHKIESSGKILWTKNIIGYTSYANVSGYIIVYDDEKIFLVNKETGEVNSYEFRSFGNTVSPSSQGIVDFISFHNAKDKTLIFTVNVEFYETKYRKVGSVVFDVESGEKRYKEIKFDKNFLSFLYDYPEIWVVFDDEVAGFDENGKFFSFRITNCETCLYRVNRNGNYLIVSGDGIILVLDVEKGVKVCEKNISFLEVKYYHGSNISDGYRILDISSCEVKFNGSNNHFYDGKYAYFFEPSFVPSGEEYFSLCCGGEIDKPAVYYPEKLIKFDVEEKRI